MKTLPSVVSDSRAEEREGALRAAGHTGQKIAICSQPQPHRLVLRSHTVHRRWLAGRPVRKKKCFRSGTNELRKFARRIYSTPTHAFSLAYTHVAHTLHTYIPHAVRSIFLPTPKCLHATNPPPQKNTIWYVRMYVHRIVLKYTYTMHPPVRVGFLGQAARG